MALGWPVSENGPLPGRQIVPVARCRLTRALVFQVPCVDWFRPMVQQLIHSPASPIIRAASPDVVLRDAGDLGDRGGRVVVEEGGHGLPALGVLRDEVGVGVPVLDQQVQQPVEQREVGTRLDLQEQVGLGGGGGAPRVDDDQLGAGRFTRSIIRRKRMGWQSAMLEPMTRKTSALSKS